MIQRVCLASSLLCAACGPTSVVERWQGGIDEVDGGTSDAGREDAGSYVSRASDPACDAQGVWAVRLTSFASAVGMSTIGANWYYVELAQEGDEVVVTEHFDCGLVVRAAVSVTLSDPLIEVLSMHNLQAGRAGVMKRNGEACDFALQRFWSVRGADEATYLPMGHLDARDVPELKAEAPLPSKADPTGNEDWDDDGKPGITLRVGPNGERYTVQRDWIEWFSCNGNASDHSVCKPENAGVFGITPSTVWDSFTIRADLNNEESVIDANSPLWATGGTSDRTKNNRATFLHLGRTRDAQKARTFWSQPDVLSRCQWLREQLPVEEGDE